MSVRNMLVGAGGGRRPNPPTSVSASYSSGTQASVSFTAPVDDGGSAITSYTVTSSPGSITASGSSSPITITGLSGGTTYTFTVTATNAVGTSDASSPSNSITTAVPPGSQTYNTANFAGQVYQPPGYSTVTITLYGSGGVNQGYGGSRSGSGSRIVKTGVPVSGLYFYVPANVQSGNGTLGGYSGGPRGTADMSAYSAAAGGSAMVAVQGGTYYVAAGGGGGSHYSNPTADQIPEGQNQGGSAPSGTNGGSGAYGGCYYGGGGGGGGSTGGYGGARRIAGAPGVSANYTTLTPAGGAGINTKGYGVISWS